MPGQKRAPEYLTHLFFRTGGRLHPPLLPRIEFEPTARRLLSSINRGPRDAGQFATSTGTGSDIIDEPKFLRRVPICRRTLKAWRDNGTIPWINAKGRRVLYHSSFDGVSDSWRPKPPHGHFEIAAVVNSTFGPAGARVGIRRPRCSEDIHSRGQRRRSNRGSWIGQGGGNLNAKWVSRWAGQPKRFALGQAVRGWGG